MASLKEIKQRISSIQSTRKITSAMKMVASAKLHHTQSLTEQTLCYTEKLFGILNHLLATEYESESLYTRERTVKRIGWVVFSSNNGLCGTFNVNIWKELSDKLNRYADQNIQFLFFPVGKKIADELEKAGYEIEKEFLLLGEKPSYEEAVPLADRLIDKFASGEIDRVLLLYHHFKNMAVQELTERCFLPIKLPESVRSDSTNYLIEPSPDRLQKMLFPKILRMTLYTTLLDSVTSEHATRMTAMQTANDNASDLIQELTTQYNKQRQQAITAELSDIMGGSKR